MKTWLGVLLLCAAISAWADDDVKKGPVSYFKGFLTGEEFLKLGENDRTSYVMGLTDGFLAAPLFGADMKYVGWVNDCVKGKTNTQIAAIFRKYLEQNPGRWEKTTQPLMFEALRKACVP